MNCLGLFFKENLEAEIFSIFGVHSMFCPHIRIEHRAMLKTIYLSRNTPLRSDCVVKYSQSL